MLKQSKPQLDMKRKILCVIALLFCIISSDNLFGQSTVKPIYFFADTINVDPKLNIIEIGNEGPTYYYALSCRCMPPYYNSFITFLCYEPRQKSKVTKKKPAHNYVSLKDLIEMAITRGDGFESYYLLTIVEPLPNGTFVESKVKIKRSRKELVVE